LYLRIVKPQTKSMIKLFSILNVRNSNMNSLFNEENSNQFVYSNKRMFNRELNNIEIQKQKTT